jgi:hypothetical protein
MKLLINTTGVSSNPFSAVSAEGYPITPLLVYACIPTVVTWRRRWRRGRRCASPRGGKPARRRGSPRVFGVTSYHQNSLMRIRSFLMSWVRGPTGHA